MKRSKDGARSGTAAGDPLWYKDAVIYEVHVRAFCDSDGDGFGDFPGLTSKLDYLQDLGVTTLWLLPFNPSPLRDDGYDVAAYMSVHEMYGTTRDVEVFLREAHRRGLRVITELVMNHTSDQHEWFQRARRAKPGSPERDFYVWSDDPRKYGDARIIFKDFEASNWTWDPVAKSYYWHRFYAHQPDLNFDSPRVRAKMREILDFWASRGVDGFRLDAVPYLFEREGTNCENLPETHAFLRDLRRHIDKHHPGRLFLAEANQWPEDAAAYFGAGDECHMAFHFPVMPRLFMAMTMEDRYPIIDILEQTPEIPPACQWATFLRNHDELTLEMVTDEERDYMYRVYAQDQRARINLGIRRRLAPLVGNNRRRIELLNGLLFSLPGTPVLYYGDEIGMGDNIYLGDRDAVRTPMQWSADRNAGFSRADPQQLYLPVVATAEFNPDAINVESQRANLSSLWWWMKRLIALRRRYRAFSRGAITFLNPSNRRVLAFIRSDGDEHLLVVANLSRFVQYVELDLSAYQGFKPLELFGGTAFPPIGSLPYLLTLGPHSFYWFRLCDADSVAATTPSGAETAPAITAAGSWESVFDVATAELEAALVRHLPTQRWFGSKARRIRNVTIDDTISVPTPRGRVRLAFVRATFVEGEAEVYCVPLVFVPGPVESPAPAHAVARLACREGEGMLYDALWIPEFQAALLEAIQRGQRFPGRTGELVGHRTKPARAAFGSTRDTPAGRVLSGEQSNTSIAFDERFMLKILRRLNEGTNPDLEVGRFLTETAAFPHSPPVLGDLTFERRRRPPVTLGILTGFVPHQGDAWRFTLDAVDQYLERVIERVGTGARPDAPPTPLGTPAGVPPPFVAETIGPYLECARLLGLRTAEMHVALASCTEDPEFAPEPVGALYPRAFYQSVRNLTRTTLDLCRGARAGLPAGVRTDLDRLVGAESAADACLRRILGRKLTTQRIRVHGDYHLGQLLHTGRDFMILDFEGEPARSLGERRLKQPPLRDVASMLRSFQYATHASLLRDRARAVWGGEPPEHLHPWMRAWWGWVSAVFVAAYDEHTATAGLLPEPGEAQLLLDVFLLEKALYELRYELNHRPDWVAVPLAGVLELLQLD